MSRVIKNNDGVAIVEGTPAASLVKDVDKFFAAKPPERMAGESIAPVRRDTMLTGKIKDKDGNEIVGRKPTPKEFDSFLAEQGIFKLREEPLPPRPTVGPEPEPPPRRERDTMYGEGEGPLTPRPKVSPNPRPPIKPTVGPEPEPPPRPPIKPTVGPEPTPPPRPTVGPEPEPPVNRRNEAKNKAESRRKRFFERIRSKKEARRSQREQEATQGKFITTLRR